MERIDFGQRSADYARHRPGFPASFFERLETYIALDGIDAVDLGTGPGVVAIELARRGAAVTGLDIAEGQILAAQEAAREHNLQEHCAFYVGSAESIELPDNCADLVTAGQCWHWFDEPRAIAEIERILRPSGHLVIGQYCYLPQWSEVARRTETLIMQHNPGWSMGGCTGLYPGQIDAVQQSRLRLIEQRCYDHAQPMSHADWRGRTRTCNGVGSGPLSPEQVEAFDRELAHMLAEHFPREPLAILHRVWMVVCCNDDGPARD